MKYFDTSALLRAWKEGWPPPKGITRPHTVAEWMHIQVGRGLVYEREDGTVEKLNLPWDEAAREARRMFSQMTFVDLSGEQTLQAAEELSHIAGLSARAVHDYMHIAAATLHKASALVTVNVAEWAKAHQAPVGTARAACPAARLTAGCDRLA